MNYLATTKKGFDFPSQNTFPDKAFIRIQNKSVSSEHTVDQVTLNHADKGLLFIRNIRTGKKCDLSDLDRCVVGGARWWLALSPGIF